MADILFPVALEHIDDGDFYHSITTRLLAH